MQNVEIIAILATHATTFDIVSHWESYPSRKMGIERLSHQETTTIITASWNKQYTRKTIEP